MLYSLVIVIASMSATTTAPSTKPPRNDDVAHLTMVTSDDRYYAVNVSIGLCSSDLQNFTLAIDLTGVETALGDISLDPRRGRGFVLYNGTNVVHNFTEYYTMNNNVQFSPSMGATEEITVFKKWKTNDDTERSYEAYKSQPFDGVLGLPLDEIRRYAAYFEKTCANDTATDAGVLVVNGLEAHGCESFDFFESSQDYCELMFVTSGMVQVQNVTDFGNDVATLVIAILPHIYLPSGTFDRVNDVYNATKVGDVYVVDCHASPGPLEIWFGDRILNLNYSDLVERIDEHHCAFLVRPSTGRELACFDYTVDFILGLPFLQGYCVAAETSAQGPQRVGLASRTNRKSRVCDYRGTFPTTTLAFTAPRYTTATTATQGLTTPRHHTTAPARKTGLRPGFIVLIIVSCASLFCVIATVSYIYRRQKKFMDKNKFELSRMPHYVGQTAWSFRSWMYRPRPREPFEIAEDELDLSTARQIGSGAFAKVFVVDVKKSFEKRLNDRATRSKRTHQLPKVVVKAARSTREEAKHEMLQEIELMKEIGSHPHVVKFLGYVALECPLIVMEYCAAGDLLNYLRTHLQAHKESIADVNEYLQSARYSNSGISLKDLISLCWQVADGMVFLSSNGYIHRDIAARNVLLAEGLVAKISDFGLCRCTDDSVYLTTRGGKLPVRWMAPEALQRATYSAATDVWSFGVLLYEMFSAGEMPYGDLRQEHLLAHLLEGNRLEQPLLCPADVYAFMTDCWSLSPNERPSSTGVREFFERRLKYLSQGYGYLEISSQSQVE